MAAGQQPSQIRFANASQYFFPMLTSRSVHFSLSDPAVKALMMRECPRLY
ncbi:hypothetical protein C3B79_1832 [Aeromonas hydrophila]|nr:hypothetical protein C3B79_1832 [Aeromonas hydrophila]